MGRANTNKGMISIRFSIRFSIRDSHIKGTRFKCDGLFSHSNSNCYAFRGAVFVKKYV